MSRFVPIILAGGKGERFWPLSRLDRPKQFLKLLPDGRSLIRATTDRLMPLVGGWEHLWVLTTFNLLEGIGEHLPPLPAENLLVEPEPRDTAAAVAYATLLAQQMYGPEVTVGIFPADHYIADEDGFRAAIGAAADFAREHEAIVTLGIRPTFPSTGYGYIQQGAEAGLSNGYETYKVLRFAEKPNQATAEAYLREGGYWWNGGIFVFRAGVMLAEFERYAPEILSLLQARGRDAYPELPKRSLDYAVMEHTDKTYVIPADFGWDDLGDWNALERLLGSGTPESNLALARHVGIDTQGSILYTTGDEVIVTLGLDNVLIVRDGPVTLIVKKERSQEIKKVLEALRKDPQLVGLL